MRVEGRRTYEDNSRSQAVMVYGLWLKVYGLWFKGLAFRVQGFGIKILGSGSRSEVGYHMHTARSPGVRSRGYLAQRSTHHPLGPP